MYKPRILHGKKAGYVADLLMSDTISERYASGNLMAIWALDYVELMGRCMYCTYGYMYIQ